MSSLNLVVRVAEFPANPLREKARHARREQSAWFNNAANFAQERLVVVDVLSVMVVAVVVVVVIGRECPIWDFLSLLHLDDDDTVILLQQYYYYFFKANPACLWL